MAENRGPMWFINAEYKKDCIMKYGYARVSTKSQVLTEQKKALVSLGVPEKNIVCEKVSGTIIAVNRKGFSKLLKKLVSGDELVVLKLDRLGRTAHDILGVINDLRQRNVVVTIDGVGTIKNDMLGTMMVNMLAAFAEFERSMIVERMQTGRQISISNGKKMGRKFKLSATAMKTITKRRKAGELAMDLANEYNVTRHTIARIVAMHQRPVRPHTDS